MPRSEFYDDIGMDAATHGATLHYAEQTCHQGYEVGYGGQRWWFPKAFDQVSKARSDGTVQNQLIEREVTPTFHP